MPDYDTTALTPFGVSHIDYEDGVPYRVTVPARSFIATGNALLSSFPSIRSINLTEASSLVDQVCKVEALSRIDSLSLINQQITDDDVRLLCTTPSLRNLRQLDLPYNRISDEGAKRLARAALPALEGVRLTGNSIGDPGALALMKSVTLRGLRGLAIDDNCLSSAAERSVSTWNADRSMLAR